VNRRIVIPEGACPPHEHDIDQSLHIAIAEAMGERKVRFTDRRLIIIFVFVVVAAILGFLVLKGQQDQRDRDFDAFRRATLYNCQREQFIVDKANAYYEAQIVATRARVDLDPVTRDTLIRNFTQAEFPSLRCDDFPGG
jgi:uncharacterized ion transporter superfamily protein YfcC